MTSSYSPWSEWTIIPAKVCCGRGLRQHKHRPQDISTDHKDQSVRTTFFCSHETSFRGNKVNKMNNGTNGKQKKTKNICRLYFKKTNQTHPKTGKEETANIKGFPKERRRKPSSLTFSHPSLQRLQDADSFCNPFLPLMGTVTQVATGTPLLKFTLIYPSEQQISRK